MLSRSITLIEPLQFYWMRRNIAAADSVCPLQSNLAKSSCRRRSMQTGPKLRRGFVRRRRPVIDGRSSDEASACRRRPSKCGPVLRRSTPHRRTPIVMCPKPKRHPVKSAFLYNHSDSSSPSALPFPGSGRSRRFPAAAPFRRN